MLRELAKGESELLKPRTNLESFYGYSYPEAQTAFETKPGDEIEHLDRLVELGYLDRQFFDKVHLCPFCSHFALNFREVCPRCESANIDIRPTSNYLCSSCKHIFPEPKVSCLSLTCGQAFGVERAVTRPIYAYRLTKKGTLAAVRGTIEDIGFSGAFVSADLAIYTFPFFEELLAQEIRRARRYDRPFSIMLASFDHLEAYFSFEAKFGKEETASLFRAIALAVKEALRDCDITALYREETLAFLLPDTPIERAYVAADRIRREIFELNPPEREPKITLSVGLVGLSDELGSARQMIDAANKRLKEAKQAGGNCVWPVKKGSQEEKR